MKEEDWRFHRKPKIDVLPTIESEIHKNSKNYYGTKFKKKNTHFESSRQSKLASIFHDLNNS